MMNLTDEHVSGKALEHLGLVAAVIDKIELIEKIDARLPLHNAKTSMGQRVAAMLYNGLGFLDDRLYMFPHFLDNKPVDRLFRGDVAAEHFNDDALGRCLDAIYTYGVTKFFTEIAFEIGAEQGYLGKTFQVDTTSLSLYGDYEEQEEDYGPLWDPSHGAKPRRGYAKNRRFDLKQMVLTLATTGKSAFPIWMEAHSGNVSDQKVLYEASDRMRKLCKGLKNAPEFMTIGDSAIYDACLKDCMGMLWLTRVPERHKIVKEKLTQPDAAYNWVDLGNGYKMSVDELSYRGVMQRWAVIFSEQAYTRECKTLDKRIQEKEKKLTTALRDLGNQVFGLSLIHI
jgi:transposase